jgi:DNA-binding transcriptional LysR family regulator
VLSLDSGWANLAILTPLVLNTELPLEKADLGSCSVVPCIQTDMAQDLTARRLMRINQLILGDDRQQSDGVAAGLLRGGRKWRVNDLQMKAEMIYAGLGWGYLPLALAAAHLASGHLTKIDLPTVVEMRVDFMVARRTDRVIGPIATAAWDLLEAAD